MTNEATKYFYDLRPESVLDAIEEIGVRCTGRAIALNSLENRVYEVEIEINDDNSLSSRFDRFRIAKFYRPGRWTKEQIEEEHSFLQQLYSEHIKVVCPIPFKDGSTLKKLPNTEIWYTVFPKIGGRLLDELQDQQLETVGHLLARLHTVGENQIPKHRIHLDQETYGYNSLDYLLDHDALPYTMRDRYIDLVEEICEIYQSWTKGLHLQRVHGDFHCGNIIWDDNECMIVDFDDFLSGPTVQDIWLCTPGRDEETNRKRNVLLSAYERIRNFNYDSIRLIEPLRALRMVHFSAWILKRWEDPAFPKVFEGFGSDKYWHEQLIALEEVRRFIYTGES